ncbi:vacuolar protein sorting-associated protein 37D-like [Cololabis saira]|uniref:vacuolar protein sorting-associated protein 37D-like n=1 Tax=Cololabis saira TaxID=129043 RepID=UPI002AD4392D|nr:vacuolar protein sorting-associated protein 37D-like [Cololabis saira]
MSLLVQLQLGAWRTRELRELLENEERINHIISSSEKLQGLQETADNLLVSNQKLAKASLSQKPKLRDAKLILATKYKELEKLRSLINAKREQLAEKRIHHALQCLLQKINDAEMENETLFQRFADRNISADSLDSFLGARRLHHIRLVLVKKLQEILRHEEETTLSDVFPEHFLLSFPGQIHPLCGLSAAVVLPACCHPPFLLPLGIHANTALRLQHSPFCPDDDDDEFPRSGLHKRGLRWPARPARLQPLTVQQRRHPHK